ncbi:MAG: Ig-like domain-containing protein, partial [Treponema sp.]|nr:Ig-like domain-containing protein [Treponema sp.]
MKSTAIQNHGWGGVFLAATLTATLLALFSGCKNPTSSSWEEPVRDYFEKYTNTAAIEKHEINAESIKDKNDTSCVSSDGAKTLTFYLRNPREYTLITDFPPANDTGVTIEQDRQDKTIIRVTYPQAYLQENEGGGQIGGTIRLTEDETLREFDSYSFSLKCNTPPPAVTRQCVNASNSTNTYWVCFWLPTAELANPIHADVKTLYIKGVTQKSVDITDLATENDGNPGDLRALDDTAAFTTPTSGEYTAFYYNTGRIVHDGENIQWNIYLEDNDGLKSKTMTASTKTTPVHMTISGGDLLTTNEGDNTLNLTASVDSPVTSWSWSSNTPTVATVPDGANDSTVTVTAVDGDGGEVTITATAHLADGRTVQKTKRIRVLGLFLDDSQQDFIKGQTGAYISAIKPDFATVSWTSENSAVATISEGGALNAVAKGSATIVATASYGGKTVSKQMTVYVHEITVSGGDDVTELFVGGATATFTVTPDSPDGRSLHSISYTWTAEGSAASISSGSSGPSRTVSPVSAGTTTLTCTVQLGAMSITLATKTIKVYELKISGNTIFKKQSGTYTLSKSLTTGGGTPYSGSGITYTWQSGTVATATITNAGVLTTVAGGSTVITVTAKRGSTTLCSATKTIYVVEVTGCTTFIKGETPRALTITPASISGYTYTLSPTSTAYATVEQSTKKITAKQAGNTTLSLNIQKSSSDYINIDIAITIIDISATCGYTKDGVAQIAQNTSFALSTTTSTLPTGATITYTSSTPSTANYNATSGKITSGSTTGTSTIKARITMRDGSYT